MIAMYAFLASLCFAALGTFLRHKGKEANGTYFVCLAVIALGDAIASGVIEVLQIHMNK
jgi:hypothetical protein